LTSAAWGSPSWIKRGLLLREGREEGLEGKAREGEERTYY